jgi:hypothetical protein
MKHKRLICNFYILRDLYESELHLLSGTKMVVCTQPLPSPVLCVTNFLLFLFLLKACVFSLQNKKYFIKNKLHINM